MWYALVDKNNCILHDQDERTTVFSTEEAAWKFKLDNELDEFQVKAVNIRIPR